MRLRRLTSRPKSKRDPFVRPLLIAVPLLAVPVMPCFAQQPAPTPGTLTLPNAPLSNGLNDTKPLITDIFVGKNTVGPYLLSWKNVDAVGEVVSRSGETLVRGVDYTLDPATGVLTFTKPLRSSQIARVEYSYTPGKATANNPATLTPLQFDLVQNRNSALAMNVLFRPATNPMVGANGKLIAGSEGVMLLGFGGNTKFSGTNQLTSKLFLDAHGGGLLDRGGMQLAEKSTTRFGQFNAGFSRAGSGFAAAQETGITAGKQIIDASGSLNPILGIRASATFKQTTELPADAKTKGAVVTTLGQQLAGPLGSTSKFNLARTETMTEAADGTSIARTNSRLQFDQKFDKRTQATALLETNETAAKDTRTTAQTGTLTVRSQPITGLSVQGSFQNKLLTTGAEDTTSFKMEATPVKAWKLTAQLGDTFNHQSVLHKREASLAYTPGTLFSITGLVRARSEFGSTTDTDALTTGVDATVKPIKALEVTGTARMREESSKGVLAANTPDTYGVKFSYSLLKKNKDNLKLTGDYADNPEDEKGKVTRLRSRSIGLQSKLGRFEMTSNFALQDDYIATKCSTVMDFKLGWRFAPTTLVTTGYKGALTQDPTSLLNADTYTFSLTHKIGSLLDLMLNGSMTLYQKNGLPQSGTEYKAEANLGVRF